MGLIVLLLSLWFQAAPPQTPPDALVARLAIEIARERDVPPIPLDAGGGPAHAVAYDQFRLIMLAARSAPAGTVSDPPAPSVVRKLLIVALPLGDGPRQNRPQEVQLFDAQRRLVERLSAACEPEPATRTPGVASTPLACAATFDRLALRPDDLVQITYADAAEPGGSRTISLPVRVVTPRQVHEVYPEMPPNEPIPEAPVVVKVEALIDLDGAVRYPRVASGPPAFGEAAVKTVQQWRFEPARVNGAVIPVLATLTVTYAPRRPGE